MPAHPPVVSYYKAVFDERFEDACVFATHATARDIRTVAIRGDITSLYFDDLDLRWKQGPVWLTGLTTPASLFCLDLLARDRGMRLKYYLVKPSMEAIRGVLDGAPPRRTMMTHLPTSDPSDLVFWIIAPSARAAQQERANA
jgi:hypothetical protein